MPRYHRRDTPEYALHVIEGAQPIGRQVTAATGLLAILLIAMSTVEAPLPQQDIAADTTGTIERQLPNEPGLLCAIGDTVIDWIAVEAS